MPKSNLSPFERFSQKIQRLESGCWQWTSTILKNGYGTLSVDGQSVYAHIFAFESFRFPVPKGLTLDHKCRNRGCANPFHTFPETRGRNVMLGDTIAARNAAKTHCPKGHPYSEDNTYRPKRGGRMCNECRRIRDRLKSKSSKPAAKVPF